MSSNSNIYSPFPNNCENRLKGDTCVMLVDVYIYVSFSLMSLVIVYQYLVNVLN